jgi:hypothetical protein
MRTKVSLSLLDPMNSLVVSLGGIEASFSCAEPQPKKTLRATVAR